MEDFCTLWLQLFCASGDVVPSLGRGAQCFMDVFAHGVQRDGSDVHED